MPRRPVQQQQRPFRPSQQLQQQPIRTTSRQQRIVFQPSFRPAQNLVPTQQRLTLPAAQTPTAFHKKPHKKPHFAGQQQFAAQQQQQINFQQQQQQSFQFSQKQEQDLSTVYGPPQPQGIYPPPSQPDQQYAAPQQPDQPEAENNTEDADESEDETELVDGPAVSVANAVSNNGQYYILGEDNVLQRVVYMTARDQRTNGFTAKLQYAPVEPIRDPIYSYDQFGQLVRIYNK